MSVTWQIKCTDGKKDAVALSVGRTVIGRGHLLQVCENFNRSKRFMNKARVYIAVVGICGFENGKFGFMSIASRFL